MNADLETSTNITPNGDLEILLVWRDKITDERSEFEKRREFEKRFPVPEGVVWKGGHYNLIDMTYGDWGTLQWYRQLYSGWKAARGADSQDAKLVNVLLDLLDSFYSLYEEGVQCNEYDGDESGIYLGNAVKLPEETENRIINLLKQHRPRIVAIKEEK